MLKQLILFYLIAFFCILAAPPSQAAGKAIGLELTTGRTTVHLTFTLPKAGRTKVFTLENPDRLVVDIPQFHGSRALSLPPTYRGKLIKGVRVGQFNPETVRIVFELSEPPASLTSSASGETLTVSVTRSGMAATDTADSVKSTKKSARKESPGAASALKADETRPVIVIDAGHGGQDPGAEGPRGTYEKTIVLDYARALKRALNATGRYRAVLTRDGDYFILLRERVGIARKAGGDLFISLHADSAPTLAARGLSVYTLSETASDKEAEALAARENRVDVLSGMDLSHESEDVAGILISLAQRETNNTSALFADTLVRALDNNNVRLLENTHRFAGFAVLKAPDMPSVLVEIGFLSHPEEEKLLLERKYREQLIKGLVKGIDTFFKKKQSSGV